MATSVEPELCSAARTNDLATIERLLASGNADLAALGPNGFNPTHAAAHAGADAVLGALLAAGADASILSGRGDSALHLAAHGGHEGAVALLLNIGGDTTATTVDQPNASGWTPLALCVISAASAAARLRCARLLLARGADPGRAAQGGWSAALLAAQRGDAALLGALLGVGGDGDGGATAQRLLAATTPEGDTPLLLAAHAGSPDALRLLLAAGPETARARNRRGLGAIDLAVCGACAAPAAAEPPPQSDDAAAATDAQTTRFDEAVRVLAAELADGSGRLPPGAAATPSPLHVVACAPPQVGIRRLAALAATLRRAGLDDGGGGDDDAPAAAAADGAPPPPSAAAAAERRGRAELAALLRAPTPPRGPLVALRVPYEGGAPSTLTVVEGAIAVPPLDAEAPELKHALTSRSRAALGRQGVQGGGAAADGDADDGLAAEALATATEEAVARAGGVARRERRFALLAEVSPDAKGALKPAAVDAAIRRAAKRAGKRPPPPSAAALARAAQEAVDGAAAAAAGAAAAAAPPPVRYRQARRWSSATVEVVELTAAKGAPVVRPQHLAMLREAFGGTLPDDLLEADEARGWALYEEEVNGATGGAAAGSADGAVGGGAPAVAEVFSLDAPLLLAFLSAPAGGDDEMEAGGDGDADGGEEGEGEGEDAADGDADALAESRMDAGS